MAFPALVFSTFTTALVYGAAGALAARQVVRVWRSVPWQADLAAGLVAVSVAATLFGLEVGLFVLAVSLAAAVIAGWMEPAAGLTGGRGRFAAAGIMLQAVGPVAIACGAMVVLREHNPVVAGVLFLMVCAYEAGDFLIGSGGSTAIEGPIAGGLAFVLVGFPAALLWLEPFDVMGIWLLVAAAITCLLGQWAASAVLPRPGAKVPALRRIDTLLVLAPLWVAATGAF